MDALKIESPICESLLRERIAEAWNIRRIGKNVNAILDTCMPREPLCKITSHGNGRVCWTPESDPAAWTGFRAPAPGADRRDIDEIPPEELANAMMQIVQDFQSCQTDALYRETVKIFGFASLTAKMRPFLDSALALMQAKL